EPNTRREIPPRRTQHPAARLLQDEPNRSLGPSPLPRRTPTPNATTNPTHRRPTPPRPPQTRPTTCEENQAKTRSLPGRLAPVPSRPGSRIGRSLPSQAPRPRPRRPTHPPSHTFARGAVGKHTIPPADSE